MLTQDFVCTNKNIFYRSSSSSSFAEYSDKENVRAANLLYSVRNMGIEAISGLHKKRSKSQ